MPRLEGVEGQDDKENFLFSGVFEVFPEVKVGDLSGQEVEKVTASVGDAEVEKTIDILRQQRTRFNHTERAAKDGDRVIIDFAGKIDGEAFCRRFCRKLCLHIGSRPNAAELKQA